MLMNNTMRIQIRKSVFETNSSSVHTITITKNPNNLKFPKKLIFDSGDYGWEHDCLTTPEEKASYLWEGIIYVFPDHENKNLTEYNKAIASITKILKSVGVKAVFKYNNPKYEESKYGDYYKFYNKVGFKTSSEFGIFPTSGYPMTEPRCMMCQPTYEGSLDGVHGYIVYDMYFNA